MIPSERAHLRIATSTHPGMSGKNNEDRLAVSTYRIEGDRPRSVVLAVVADGIGGHRAGEVAAELAVNTITRGVAQSDGSNPIEVLRESIQQAAQTIYAHSQTDDAQRGMGATCACALVIEDHLFIAYVGDSRIYLLRGGTIQQLTIDHTWIQEALDAGVISPEQAEGHPNAHVIRRYLGSPTQVDVDTRIHLVPGESDEQMLAHQGMILEPGDTLVLCSDGLTDLVEPQEILAELTGPGVIDHPKGLKILTDKANQRGGHDNITIVTLQMPAGAAALAPTVPIRIQAEGKRSWKALSTCLGGVLLALLVVAALAAAYFLWRQSQPTPTPTASVPVQSPTVTTVAATSPAAITPTATVTLEVFPGGTGTAVPTGIQPAVPPTGPASTEAGGGTAITTPAAIATGTHQPGAGIGMPTATFTAWPTSTP